MIGLSSEILDKTLLFILIVLIPLTFLQNGISPYESPKYYIFIICTVTLFILTICQRIFRKDIAKSFHLDFILICTMAFVGIQLIADLAGLDPYFSLIGSPIRHQGIITLFLLSLLVVSIRMTNITNKDMSIVYSFMRIANIFVTMFTFIQIISFYIFKISIPLYDGRIVGTFGNPSLLGGFIAMTLPFLLFWRTANVELRFLKFALILENMLVLLLTESRAAILSVFITSIYLLIKMFRLKMIWGHCFAILLTICVFTVIISHSLNSQYYYLNTITDTKNLENTLLRDSYWNNRWIIWENAFAAISKRPLTGYGQENFQLTFPKEQRLAVDQSHNIFLEITLNGGIVELLLFLRIFIYAVRHSTFQVQLSLIAFLVIAQFNPLSLVHLIYLWVLLGMASNTTLQNSPTSGENIYS